MASTGWNNYYSLSITEIDRVITRTSAGAYALGAVSNNTFNISYIGRSDSDLNARLKQHVGKYIHFKAGYLDSPKAAFEKECHLFHDFSPTDNTIHPDRPNGSGWKCPRCNKF